MYQKELTIGGTLIEIQFNTMSSKDKKTGGGASKGALKRIICSLPVVVLTSGGGR